MATAKKPNPFEKKGASKPGDKSKPKPKAADTKKKC